ncbi:MAG: hypothetical protein KDA25_12485 [Phycisphaerales bacterium]|nr:hypothetical protein [Phycisphaerales bacterium]
MTPDAAAYNGQDLTSMRTPEHHPDDLALWTRSGAGYGTGQGTGSADAPSLMDLAAYLDGRLTADAREAMEAALLDHPDALDAVIEARLEATAPVVATIGPSGVDTPRRRTMLTMATRWGLAAAAAVAVSFVGYHAGSRATMSEVAATGPDLLNDVTFGMLDVTDTSDETTFDLSAIGPGTSAPGETTP